MRRYIIKARVEQPRPGEFLAVAWAEPLDSEPRIPEAESIESRALTHEHAARMLPGLASTLAGAIRLRGDAVDSVEIEGGEPYPAAGAS